MDDNNAQIQVDTQKEEFKPSFVEMNDSAQKQEEVLSFLPEQQEAVAVPAELDSFDTVFKDVDQLFKSKRKWCGDSFEMKILRQCAGDLLLLKKSVGNQSPEAQGRLLSALLRLNEACSRYKEAKFKNTAGTKNLHHRLAEVLLRDTDRLIENLTSFDAMQKASENEYLSVRNTMKTLPKRGAAAESQRCLKNLNKLLEKDVPVIAEERKKDKQELVSSYKTAIDAMEAYLKSKKGALTWSVSEDYRKVLATKNQLMLEMRLVERLNDRVYGSWEDILSQKKLSVENNNTFQEGEENLKATAIEQVFGSGAYFHYSRAENRTEDGVKQGCVVRHPETFFGFSSIKKLAKQSKALLVYSDECMKKLTSIQLMDIILGVENRAENTIGYTYSKSIINGTLTYTLEDAKVISTNQLLTEKNPKEYNECGKKPFFYTTEGQGGIRTRDKLVLGAYDLQLANRIINTDANHIIASMQQMGINFSDSQAKALIRRYLKLQKLLKADIKTEAKADLKDGVGKQIRQNRREDSNSYLYLNTEYVGNLTENSHTEQIKASIRGEFAPQQEQDARNTIVTSTSSGQKMSDSKQKLETSTNKLFETFFDKNTGAYNMSDEMNLLRSYILSYAKIRVTAEEVLKYTGEKLFRRRMVAVSGGALRTAIGFFDEAGPQEEYAKVTPIEGEKVFISGKSDLRIESRQLQDILTLIRELKVKNAGKEKELNCLTKLEELLSFSEGNLKTEERPEDSIVKDCTKVVFYHREPEGENAAEKKKNKEKGLGKSVLVEMESVKDQPLFAHEPCIEDVAQGGVGDCWFLSTIAAIAEKDPDYIKGMMKDNGDTVTIRLYDVKGRENYITVTKEVPKEVKDYSAFGGDIYMDQFAKGAIWVQLLEKALTASGIMAGFRKWKTPGKKVLKNKNVSEVQEVSQEEEFYLLEKQENGTVGRSYSSIASSRSRYAFKILTGGTYEHTKLKDLLDDWEDGKAPSLAMSEEKVGIKFKKQIEEILSTIEDAGTEGQVITASTQDFKSGDLKGENGEAASSGLYGKHSYTVLGVETVAGKKMIKLRNPWGRGGIHYRTQAGTGATESLETDLLESGPFYVSPERFLQCFKSITTMTFRDDQ